MSLCTLPRNTQYDHPVYITITGSSTRVPTSRNSVLRPFADDAKHQQETPRLNQQVNEHVAGKGDRNVEAGQRRRHRFGRAQQPVEAQPTMIRKAKNGIATGGRWSRAAHASATIRPAARGRASQRWRNSFSLPCRSKSRTGLAARVGRCPRALPWQRA